MRVDVVGRNMEVTDAIREHAESRAEKLPRYYDGVQQVTVTIEGDHHHQHGPFSVEMVVDVVRHEPMVSHASDEDLYKAIDTASHKSERQLRDFKERLRENKR